MGNSQKIVVGSMHISADSSGNVSMISNLIDPYIVVELPSVDGLEPADNQNTQLTNSSGDYGFLVYPNIDYYIVVSRNGYDTYISRTISVGNSIVKYSVQLNPSVKGVKRMPGGTRIDTSIEIAKAGFSGKVKSIVFAAASNFPDALSGSIYAAKYNASVSLVQDKLTDGEISYIKNHKISGAAVFGGEGVVSNSILERVNSLLIK